MNKTIILVTHSPFGQSHGREAIDLALLLGSFEQEVDVIFQHDGVFHLLRNQEPSLIETKDYTAVLKALHFYDINTIYACEKSLEKRQISDEISIKTHIKKLSYEKQHTLLHQAKNILVF